jgi:tetratricopeptide (TPR) repeat protein
MVAIYRSGYGYVDTANGMSISGLEDEFRFSQRNGIDVLYYVERSPADRDVRLSEMIEEIKKGPQVLWFYDDPEELRTRVRDDLTTLITERVLNSETRRDVLRETSANYLERTRNRIGTIVARAETVERLSHAAAANEILCLCGPAGIGKTTLAAQLAERIGAIYVRVTGLAPRDIFSVCATALYQRPQQSQEVYSTLEGARLGLAAAWAEAGEVTLIVDECDFLDELIHALALTANQMASRHLVITARDPIVGVAVFDVPPLTRVEAEQIALQSGVTVGDDVLDSGHPLSIHTAILDAEGKLSTAVGISQSSSVGGELLRYLALSPTPLSADDLLRLRGDGTSSIEELYVDLRSLGRIVDDSPRGLRLMHTDTAAAVLTELQTTPQRLSFYVHRLMRLFEEMGDLRVVYELASLLNDGTEDRYVAATAWQAARLGDWRTTVRLIDRLLQAALDDERKAEAFELMLSLIHPLEVTGAAGSAASLVNKAEVLAQSLDERAHRQLEIVKIFSRARRGLSVTDVAALENLYKEYETEGSQWDQAHVGLELSALYMSTKEYEKAREVLQTTYSLFREVGDDYGLDLAQRNLAGTLAHLDGYEREADKLIQKIRGRSADEIDARRQRAWLCNILTARLRKAGRLDEAEALAKEAIEIGDALGDESLRAINLINLGNVFRDRKHPEVAIKAYEQAGLAAQKCGRHDVEADSSRLIAGILNDFQTIPGIVDRLLRARSHAEHAVGLLTGTVYHAALANSLQELAKACEGQGDGSCAVKNYFRAALECAAIPDEHGLERALLHGSYVALPDHTEDYLEGLSAVFPPKTDLPETLPNRFLICALPILQHAPRRALIPLLGRHLQQVWSHLLPSLHPAIVSAVTGMLREFARSNTDRANHWRILYGGIVLASLLKEGSSPYMFATLASAITLYGHDLFVREEGDGTRIWTVVLNLGRRLVISIDTLDTSDDSNVATFALAMFIKAFEDGFARELVANAQIDELSVHVARLDQFPTDVRRDAVAILDLDRVVEKQGCAVTRTVNYESGMPIYVLLSPSFLQGIEFGEGRGGALQALFALTLQELTYQLLRGDIQEEEIRPKIISLVRETCLE